MAVEPVFVDTNVLVYRVWQAAPQHPQAVAALQSLAGRGSICWLSRQVLREYLCAVTRHLAAGPIRSQSEAVADVRWLAQRFEVAEDGPDVTARLLDLLLRHPTAGKQIHDANIVATMLVHRIGRLLTFNSADFTRFAGLIELEPV